MRLKTFLIILGLLSLLFYLWMWNLSFEFNWGEDYEKRPIPTYLFIYFSLFIIYAFAIWGVRNFSFQRSQFWTWIIFGLLFRIALLPAQQIQEDDVYRYLWDGKVFANGINPFKFAPEEINNFKEFMIKEPRRFQKTYDEKDIRELTLLYQLKWENETSLVFMERINHPHVPTIYPPMAQYVFRWVNHIKPDSILGMRLAFLFFDFICLFFIVAILIRLDLDKNLALIYYWSPLVIKETFNSTHLDIIGIAFLCIALYYFVCNKFYRAHSFLAFSVLGKLYSIILLPLYLKQLWQNHRETSAWKPIGISLILFFGIIGIFYAPFLGIGQRAFEGLRTFSTYWESNDSLFAIMVFYFRSMLEIESRGPVGLSYDLPSLLSKVTVVLILGGVLLYFLLRKNRLPFNRLQSIKELFIVMALVFLLSPVQNPWYLSWILPFLCIFPYRYWILLTGLVGLYYLDFYFDYQEIQHYTAWTPWFEYLPFYLLLGWEFFKRRASWIQSH